MQTQLQPTALPAVPASRTGRRMQAGAAAGASAAVTSPATDGAEQEGQQAVADQPALPLSAAGTELQPPAAAVGEQVAISAAEAVPPPAAPAAAYLPLPASIAPAPTVATQPAPVPQAPPAAVPAVALTGVLPIDNAAAAAAAAAAAEHAALVEHAQLMARPDLMQLAAQQQQQQQQQVVALQQLQQQQQAAAVAAAAVAAGTTSAEETGAPDVSGMQLHGQRKADLETLSAARRSGSSVDLEYRLELPPELADVEFGDRTGILEAPLTGDVPMLKRLFMYAAHNKLLPALQELVTEEGVVMEDYKEDNINPMPLATYQLKAGSRLLLRVVLPEELVNIPLVEEALATATYNIGGGGPSRHAGRKTRWTEDQIRALIEGVEKYGMSAWRSVVMDTRLAGKTNMQCKDKFRNLCLTVVHLRPERGLALPHALKERVKALYERERAKGGRGAKVLGLPEPPGGAESADDLLHMPPEALQHQQQQQQQDPEQQAAAEAAAAVAGLQVVPQELLQQMALGGPGGLQQLLQEQGGEGGEAAVGE